MFFPDIRDPYKKIAVIRYLFPILQACLIFLLSTACLNDPDTRFQRLDHKGENHFSQGKYYAALVDWKKALAIRPDAADIHQKIGETYLRLANLSKAADAFRQAILLQPKAWRLWLKLAQLQLVLSNVAAAEASWEQLRRIVTNDPNILVFHGDLMVAKKRLGDAELAYRQAITIAPQFEPALIKLATCYFAQGKVNEAERTYKTLISLKPRSPEILLQMSNYWKLRNNLEKAEECLIKATRMKPEDLMLQKVLADFYFDTHGYEKARAILERMLRQEPENKPVKKYLVEVLLAQNQLNEAQAILTDLSQEEANDLELHLLKGKYHMLTLEPIHAITHFRAVLEEENKLPAVHYLLGLAYLSNGQNYLARQSFIQALTLDPHFADAELALADIYYKNEEFDLSLEHSLRISGREPENFRAYLILGNILLAQHRYEEAMAKFEAARLIHPDAFSPLYYMAMTAELSHQTEKALKLYRHLLTQQPNLADVALRYARLLIQAEKIETARQFFEEAVKRAPQNGYLLHILGEVYLAAGNMIAAKVRFEQAIAAEPKVASSYMQLVNIYEKSRNWNRQIQVLEACIENIPFFPEAYVSLINIYRQKGLWEKAVATLEKAIARHPESPLLANNLAWLYLEGNTNLNKALTLAQYAYERLAEDPAVADTLGWIYYKKNLLTQAVWLLTEARLRKPDHPLIHFHLGVVYHAKGNRVAAVKSLRQALTLNLAIPYRQDAERYLQELQ